MDNIDASPWKFKLWRWAKMNKQRLLIYGAIALSVCCVGLVLYGVVYYLRVVRGYVWADVTGFGGKSFWDWMELLIIPLVLALSVTLFNIFQRRNEQRRITDQRQEDALVNYQDKMAELMLETSLLGTEGIPLEVTERSGEWATVVTVSKNMTVATLRSLDTHRQNILFRYLVDTKLNSFVLEGASLFQADLSHTNIKSINLRGADLSEVNLEGARLLDVILAEANLQEANLSNIFIRLSDLGAADLRGADLSNAFLLDVEVIEEQLQKVKWDAPFHIGSLPPDVRYT